MPYNVPGCNDYSTCGAGRTPRDLLQIMKDQFDYLYWEGEQGAPKFFAFNGQIVLEQLVKINARPWILHRRLQGA